MSEKNNAISFVGVIINRPSRCRNNIFFLLFKAQKYQITELYILWLIFLQAPITVLCIELTCVPRFGNSVRWCYTLIAFDDRITFWLQLVGSLPCACAHVALFARRLEYNHYALAHACIAANAHAQGSDRAVEAKKLLPRWRQSE